MHQPADGVVVSRSPGLAALELGLRHFGVDVALGRGVGAAQDVFSQNLPEPGAR